MYHWLELRLEFLPVPGDPQRAQRERTGMGSRLGLLAVAIPLVAFVWWRNR
jgi:hypothetical protein